MAEKFAKKEAVEFGDIKVVPKILDTETKLRLGQIQLETQEGIEKAIKLLSACFTTKNDEVEKFMEENMSDYDLRRLQVYLLKGPQMLKAMDDSIQTLIAKEANV